MSTIIIGLAAGVGCFLAATRLKRALGYDDSLDALGVHAVGGIIGAILTGVFAAGSLGGVGYADGITMSIQVGIQIIGVFALLFTQ